MATVRTTLATPARWADVVAAFGRRGNDPSWCWCQRFLEPPSSAEPLENRRALEHEIAASAVPVGVLAYVDERPVGWTRVMPRTELPGVLRNNALRRILVHDPGTWWITCFAVQRRYRNQGVARALLDAAVDHARAHGARAVEGHPVDTDALVAQHVSGSALFTGTMRLFTAAGFVETGRTYKSRPVMRRQV